ncbi:MAG: hypothetical protein ABIR27_07040, partial [Dokdonella sp.]
MNSYRYALVLCCLVVSSHAVASDWIEDTIEHGPYQIVVGDNVSMWQPGKDYHSGKDWLALRCTAQACKLDPATLTVHPESQQG